MKAEYEESRLPVTDDSKLLQQLCERLEFILKFGLRGKPNNVTFVVQSFHLNNLLTVENFLYVLVPDQLDQRIQTMAGEQVIMHTAYNAALFPLPKYCTVVSIDNS